jgi:carbon-monoxide dehydrogenase small subunit
MKNLTLKINGEAISQMVEDRTSLADFLREQCGLTATHVGCEHGACGACSVLVDEVLTRACLKFAVQCEGQVVSTLEGLQGDKIMKALQKAFHESHALQCGFCTPGMLVTARDLLARHAKPTEVDIRDALSGNLCRCTGYAAIIQAVQKAAASLS